MTWLALIALLVLAVLVIAVPIRDAGHAHREAGLLRRPRIMYRLHARLRGYFWTPCPVCGRWFSGWEWGRDDFTVWDVPPGQPTRYGVGVCSGPCRRRGLPVMTGHVRVNP